MQRVKDSRSQTYYLPECPLLLGLDVAVKVEPILALRAAAATAVLLSAATLSGGNESMTAGIPSSSARVELGLRPGTDPW